MGEKGKKELKDMLHAGNGEDGENGRLDSSPRGEEALRRQVFVSLGVCGFYIFVSSMMVFVNKALSYTYEFRTTNVLMLIQMIFTTILLLTVRSLNVISFENFQLDRAMKVAPISFFYCLNGAAALMALREMSVPSYTLVKRLAPLFTICLEYFVLAKTASIGVIFSILCMTLGTFVAFQDDKTSTLLGWSLGFTSCLLQALYLALVKRTGSQLNLNTFGILFYHSILSVPCLLVLVLVLGEHRAVTEFQNWTDVRFLIVFISSLFAGLVLNYALFLCAEKTSPTSTVVSGHIKALAQTVIGFFTFGGADTSAGYLLGTVINISGGCGYAYSKYKVLQSQMTKN